MRPPPATVALNTVKRYARSQKPERLTPRPALPSPPSSTPTATTCAGAGPRTRPSPSPTSSARSRNSATPAALNLLYRYLTQGRAEGDRPVITPRRLARLLLTRPEHLRDKDTDATAGTRRRLPRDDRTRPPHPASSPQLLTPAEGNDAKLTALDHHGSRRRPAPPARFANGLELDRAAVNAGLTLPLPQRPHRGRQHPNQTDHATDARPSRVHLLRHRILLQ